MALNEKLKEYRDLDKGHLQQTLHPDRLRAYLEREKITRENFDEKFTIDTAMQISKEGNAPGDRKMYRDLSFATQYVKQNNMTDVTWEESNPDTFASTLNKDLTVMFPNDDSKVQAATIPLMHAYRVYWEVVRNVAQKSLELRQGFKDEREGQKTDVEGKIWDKVKGTFKDVFGGVGKNWNKMTSKEKVISAGALIGIGAFLSFSQNETVKKIRSAGWKAIKYGAIGVGGVVGADYLFKLFTGETALNSLSDWNESTVGNTDMWMNHFDVTEDDAEKMQHSVVALGRLKLSTVIERFKAAKNKKVEFGSRVSKQMSSEDVYTALAAFFKKYPPDQLEKKYATSKEKPTFLDAVVNELAESGELEPKQNAVSAAASTVKEGATRAWNWFVVGEPGLGIMRKGYLAAYGREGNDEQVRKYTEEHLPKLMEESIPQEKDVQGLLDRKLGPNTKSSKGYLEAQKSSPEAGYPAIRCKEMPNDSIYMLSEVNLAGRSPSDKENIMTEATKNAYEFLKKKYPTEREENIAKMILIQAGTFVANPPKFILFLRKPTSGGEEYISHFSGTPKVREEKPGVEIFDEKSELVYNKLEEYERETLRLRFLLNSEQGPQLQEICNWYKTTYQGAGKSKQDVKNALLYGPDAERDQALTEKGLMVPGARKLFGGNDLLKGINGEDTKLTDEIEKPAAQKANNPDAYVRLQEFMKRGGEPGAKTAGGYKIRLAIAGDPEARKHLASLGANYDPVNNKDWLANTKAEYKKKCDKLVEDYNGGRLTLPG